MALYYLDPTREPRECPAHCHKPESGDGKGENCSICDGTGRLGEEGAEPDVAVFEEPMESGEWYWRHVGLWDGQNGPHPTEAAALAAARKAHREGK